MKKTQLFGLSLLMAGGLFSCSSKGDGSVTVIEKSDGVALTVCDYSLVGDTVDVPLSDWVEDFKIVRFENSDTALFKFWWPAITDNYIGIRQSGGAFKLFNHEGKFLCDVGSVGQGPGEYSGALYDEAIDEANKVVYLAPFFGSSKILKYNIDGTFVSDIDLQERLNKPTVALNPDGSISVVHLCFKGMSEMMAAHVAKDGTVKKYIPEDNLKVNPRDKDGAFVGFNNEIWGYNNVGGFPFMAMPVDTLYHYNPEANRVEARFALANAPTGKDVFLIYNELPGRFLATVWGEGTIEVNTQDNSSRYVKLVNDFVGGLEAPFNFVDGWFFSMYEPLQLMDKIEARLAAGDCTEKDKEVLNKLLDSLDENDNNIMFIGKLKK